MKTLHFNTNIKCAGCVATVTPFLNAEKHIEKWEVDVNQPNKPLTVQTDLDEKEVAKIVEKAGFKVVASGEL